MTFTVIGTNYPMEVHKQGCRDIPRNAHQWNITGDSIADAVERESASLNSGFDSVYKASDLLRPMPCTR